MPLADAQMQLGTLVMGPGTDYEIVDITGLDLGQVNPNDLPLVGNGVLAARDRLAPRQMILNLEVWGTPGASLAGKMTTFLTAWQPTNTDAHLTFKRAGITNSRYVNGRPRRVAWPENLESDMGLVRLAAEFFCPDPTIYDASTNLAVVY